MEAAISLALAQSLSLLANSEEKRPAMARRRANILQLQAPKPSCGQGRADGITLVRPPTRHVAAPVWPARDSAVPGRYPLGVENFLTTIKKNLHAVAGLDM
jgi:hypothetical protein